MTQEISVNLLDVVQHSSDSAKGRESWAPLDPSMLREHMSPAPLWLVLCPSFFLFSAPDCHQSWSRCHYYSGIVLLLEKHFSPKQE